MKQTSMKNTVLTAFALGAFAMIAFTIQSCSKSSSSGPAPLGGYTSSDSVAASALVAYFPFDGNANDVKGGQTATASSAVTYTTGIRGQAYQGAAGAYATLTPSAAFSSLPSYSLSFWYKLPAQQPSGDPGGVFFLSGTNTLNELIYEIEHYSPVSGDSVNFHNGFTNLASAGWQGFTMAAWDTSGISKWVNLLTTYDGGSSTYIVYENGTPIMNASAWGYQLSNVLYQGSNNPVGSSIPQGNLSWSTDPPQTITIGTWPATLYGVSATLGANGCFLGQLDELRVFNRALTPAEAAGLYLNGAAGR
jgi:hypothetical protein